MVDTRINEFRSAVVATIKGAMPALRSCSEQFGRFNLEELETTSIAAPAVRFAVLDADFTSTADDNQDATLRCAAFVITEGNDRERAAWGIAEAIALMLSNSQRWGLTRLLQPANARVQPVISGSIKRRGVAIHAVEWQQTLLNLGESAFDANSFVLQAITVNGDTLEPEVANAGP